MAENLQLYRVVRFFRLRSSCTTHISADVQRITLMRHAWRSPVEEPSNSYSAASLAFTSDFIGFIVVELIRFFHGALQLAITRQQRVDRNTELGMKDVRATADIPHQFQGQRSRSQVALDDRWRHHLRRAGTCGGYTAGRTACFVVVFVFVNNQYNDCTFWRCEFVAQYFCIAQFFYFVCSDICQSFTCTYQGRNWRVHSFKSPTNCLLPTFSTIFHDICSAKLSTLVWCIFSKVLQIYLFLIVSFVNFVYDAKKAAHCCKNTKR